jgi:nitroreductase
MDLFEAIKGRRSVREFLPDEVPWEDLERILDMARYAPTAGNGQPWKFLVVKDERNKAGLRETVLEFLSERIEDRGLTPEHAAKRRQGLRQFLEKIFGAPVLVFVFVDQSCHPELVGYDGALAVQNMMLAAHALGYGTSFQTTILPEGAVGDYFSIREPYRLICGVPMGKPAAQPQMPEKKELASLIWEEGPPG